MENIVISANSWSSPELGKCIDQTNRLSGGVLYDVEAKTRYQRWHFFFMKFNTLLLLMELFYFTFLVPFDLLKFITTGIQLIFISGIMFLAPWSQKQRNNVVTILNWVAVFPKRDYPIKKQEIKILMDKANNFSIFCMSFMKIVDFSTGLFLAIGFPSLRYFVNNEVFPLPFNAHLPFLPPSNMVLYFFNFMHQAYSLYFISTACTTTVGFGLCVFMQMLYDLKTIKILTEHMSDGIVSVGFDKWHESIITATVELKRFVVKFELK